MRALYLLIVTLILSHGAAAQPAFTTCVGDIGNCSTSVSSINLGPATVGGGAFVPVKITNSGSAQLVINYSFSNTAFAFGLSQTLPPNPLVIDPGASVQTFIVFTPSAVGVQAGQFVSMDNAAGSPHVIPLSGAGVNVASGDFAVMLDPAGPATIALKKGATTTFPVYVLEGPNPNPSAGGAAQCSGGPTGSSCSLQPSTFAAFVSQVKIDVSVTVPANTSRLHGSSFIWAAMLPALLLLDRRRRTAGIAPLAVLFLALCTSCGGGSSAPPITISAGVNGSSPHTLTVPVTLQ
ncbi:MAG TPA: hypothetical protein VGK01_22320 [Candidatus Angelobacter sp.]|jgi:hypothetical protein